MDNATGTSGDTRVPLVLERKNQPDGTVHIGAMSMTPAINEDYWEYRVRLSDKQAIVGFPKFTTIGIGFAVEEDWNTNLPFTTGTDEIVQHILHNKGDDAIADSDVREAVRLVQDAAWDDSGASKLLDVIDRMAQDPAYISSEYAQRVISAMRVRTGWTR
jgi:hypothetical protein